MKWRKTKNLDNKWIKANLVRRDGNTCALCGLPMITMKDISIDHIRPLSKGGLDEIENCRLVHFKCNQALGNSGLA